jgi:hypothetical protein
MWIALTAIAFASMIAFCLYASGEDHGACRSRGTEGGPQAAFAAWLGVRQFHGRSSAIRLAGWSGRRASTSASQAWGSTSLSLAVYAARRTMPNGFVFPSIRGDGHVIGSA